MLQSRFGEPVKTVASPNAVRDRSGLAAIRRQFAGALPQLAADIRSQVDAGALEAARRLAHRLKGSSGGYGYPDIMRTAAAIEAGAQAGDAARVSALALELEALCDRAAREEPPS